MGTPMLSMMLALALFGAPDPHNPGVADRCAAVLAMLHADGARGRYVEALGRSMGPGRVPVVVEGRVPGAPKGKPFVKAADACRDPAFEIVDRDKVQRDASVILLEVSPRGEGYSFVADVAIPNPTPPPHLPSGAGYGVGVLSGEVVGLAKRVNGKWVASGEP
jgi:hypothetical protein